MRTLKTLPILSAAALLAGCGGHGGGATASRAHTGRLEFTIAWPTKGRYVPTNAGLIEINIFSPGDDPATATPADTVDVTSGNNGTSDPLPEGVNYTVVASSYTTYNTSTNKPLANANATAVGQAPATVVAGPTATNVTVTLSSELGAFAATVKDYATGAGVAVGTNPYTLTPSGSLTPLSVSPTAILQVALTPQNGAATPGTLTLYPLNANATTTVSKTGGLDLYSAFPSSGENTLTGYVVPSSASPTPGAVNVVFNDLSKTPTFSVSLPFSVGPLTASFISTVTVPTTTQIDSVSAANLGYATIHLDSGVPGPTRYTVRLQRQTTVLATLETSAVPVPLDKWAVGAVAVGASDHYAYGKVGTVTVTNDAGGTETLPGTNTLLAFASYGGSLYVASTDGTTVSLDKITDFTAGIHAVTHVASLPTGTITAFAVGYDPNPSSPSKVTAFTVEAGAIVRYADSGAGFTGTTFKSDATYAGVGIDGNVVVATTTAGTVVSFDRAGTSLGFPGLPSNEPTISVVPGKAVLASSGSFDTYSITG